MNMKLNRFFAVVAIAGLVLTSCGEEFLTSHTTHQGAAGAAATESAILSYLTATYQPLLMDSYANYNYNHILLLSDLRSDDVYKGGGDAGDQSWMYHMSLFQIPASESPTGIWSLYYTAIARANNTLMAIDNAVGFDSDAAKRKLAGYKAEAHFLRAYYLHHLWKLFGNIPFFTEPLEDPFMARQKSADEIYQDIMTDIAAAEKAAGEAGDEFPMYTNGTAKQARANLAALYMLKARVVMYQNDASKYGEVASNMAAIITSGRYGLIAFDALWTGADENDFTPESIFESNQISDGKRDWGSAWTGASVTGAAPGPAAVPTCRPTSRPTNSAIPCSAAAGASARSARPPGICMRKATSAAKVPSTSSLTAPTARVSRTPASSRRSMPPVRRSVRRSAPWTSTIRTT